MPAAPVSPEMAALRAEFPAWRVTSQAVPVHPGRWYRATREGYKNLLAPDIPSLRVLLTGAERGVSVASPDG